MGDAREGDYMQARERVLEELKKIPGNENGVTAASLAKGLNLSRQVVSHYLNRLLEQGLVSKTETRPVYWKIAGEGQTTSAMEGQKMPTGDGPETADRNGQKTSVWDGKGADNWSSQKAAAPVNREEAGEEDIFDAFIGASGSQSYVTTQCKAAVNYPPDGLPILIIGESGVGKSHLAGLIYKYAAARGAVAKGAPYVVLNCADYANNPELLSSALFGYKKGSFTGAAADREGLLSEADGGYLFLDEVHRLSYENQEKLFVFMDTGRYRPLGDSRWKEASVRLIFATTEKPEEVLLDTFRRRITVQVEIPPMMARPLSERLALIGLFYRNEAEKIGKNIVVDGPVIGQLCFSKMKGNIGKLKNMVQISCANAYFRQMDREKLTITASAFPLEDWAEDWAGCGGARKVPGSMEISYTGEDDSLSGDPQSRRGEDFYRLFSRMAAEARGELERQLPVYLLEFQKLADKAVREAERQASPERAMVISICRQICSKVLSKYGITKKDDFLERMACVLSTLENGWGQEDRRNLEALLEREFPRACYVAACLETALLDSGAALQGPIRLAATLFLTEYVTEELELNGLIVAHGDSTATSICSVANQVCGAFIFEAIDMPMDISVEATIEKVNQYLAHVDAKRGVILLVDMGSLSQMYSSIKSNVPGDLLIINNLTTCIALDIGFKMKSRMPFREIAEAARDNYPVNVQYFEGIAKGNNIIVSCMSGVGIADKLRDLIEKTLEDDSLSILSLDYQELTRLLDENDKEYFKNTKLILTTSNLGADRKVPWINIYDLLGGQGEKRLELCLKGTVGQEKLELLNREFVKFFSLEGIVSRLQFLNPTVVINEVEHVLLRYERRYHLELDGRTRLNLYMHIAFMIERLMVGGPEELEEDERPRSREVEIFSQVSREIFSDIEKRYHIAINQYELSLLYELFRRVLPEAAER